MVSFLGVKDTNHNYEIGQYKISCTAWTKQPKSFSSNNIKKRRRPKESAVMYFNIYFQAAKERSSTNKGSILNYFPCKNGLFLDIYLLLVNNFVLIFECLDLDDWWQYLKGLPCSKKWSPMFFKTCFLVDFDMKY